MASNITGGAKNSSATVYAIEIPSIVGMAKSVTIIPRQVPVGMINIAVESRVMKLVKP